MSAGMLGQFAKTLNKLIDDGVWDRDDKLEVKVAGTLPKDKCIVSQNTTKRGQN